VEVAVVAVRVVERAIDPVVDVVSVGDGGVTAPGLMALGAVERGTGGRKPAVHLKAVLVVVGAVWRVEMAVVEIIGVVAVGDFLMSAARAVHVWMISVVGASHHCPPCGNRLAARKPRQWRAVAGLNGSVFVCGALFCGALLLTAGCSRTSRPSGRRVAAATIAPLSDLLARVAGPAWEVRTIVPPGTSAHMFEPAPRDVRRLAGARLVVTVGGGYDDWAGQLARAASAGAILLDAGGSLGIGLEADPHWWLSPALAARGVGAMAEALSRVDPAGAGGYRARAADTVAELDRLDRELEASLAPFRGKAFLAAHPAWPHFVARYGLRMAGSIEPAPGREPSPRQLRALIDEARAGGFDVLFTEPQFPESAARAIASDAGLRIGLLDPIGGVPGRATYFEMMRFNGTALTTTFRGAGPPLP
jgi:ABC-type Zn uptake system ZnuABC Zn-binding protein ZnuA